MPLSNALERFKKKQGIASTRDMFIIATVFSLAGASISFTVRPIHGYLFHLIPRVPMTIKGLAYLVLAVPLYQCYLLIYGSLLGQFKFFWEREKKLIRWVKSIFSRGRSAFFVSFSEKT